MSQLTFSKPAATTPDSFSNLASASLIVVALAIVEWARFPDSLRLFVGAALLVTFNHWFAVAIAHHLAMRLA